MWTLYVFVCYYFVSLVHSYGVCICIWVFERNANLLDLDFSE